MAYKRKLTIARPVVMEQRGDQTVEVVPETLGSFIAGLEGRMAEEVGEHSRAFLEARSVAGRSILAMGEHLSRLREILEPRKLWKQYLSLVPNFTQASAYRYIWGWENAQRVLPPAIARVAAIDGYKIVETRKGGKLAPRYAQAFKRVEKKLGPAPKEDEGKAREFLKAVAAEKRRVPVIAMRPVWNAKTEHEHQSGMLTRFVTDLKRVPETKRYEFGMDTVGKMTELVMETGKKGAKAAA